ncbi:MAG TPA: hypothetical protein VKB35_10135 [Ktedonobacteraceae bacterium]|nr:hypothetical protein [Ktedonobacteraceae bacterium]
MQVFEWEDEVVSSNEELLPGGELPERINERKKSESASQTSVISLADTQHCFWLIGEPGAGKSTTMQKLALLRAKELLSTGYLLKPCPILDAIPNCGSSVLSVL